MNKQEALRRIRLAKSPHIRWRAYAQALVAGLDVREEHDPVHHKACGFGKWYYGEGLRELGHLEGYRDIDDTHALLHDVYRKIFELCQNKQHARAREYMDQLVGISRTLLDALQLLEDEIKALESETV